MNEHALRAFELGFPLSACAQSAGEFLQLGFDGFRGRQRLTCRRGLKLGFLAPLGLVSGRFQTLTSFLGLGQSPGMRIRYLQRLAGRIPARGRRDRLGMPLPQFLFRLEIRQRIRVVRDLR